MSSLMIIIIVLAVNVLPVNVKEFSVELSPNETVLFSKQADGGWQAIKPGKKESTGTFFVDGLMLTASLNGKENRIDASKFLGIKTPDQIKGLTQIEMGPNKLKIDIKDSEIIIHTDNHPVKVSWKKN